MILRTRAGPSRKPSRTRLPKGVRFVNTNSTSSKLFADAEAEERAEREAQSSSTTPKKAPVQEYENWTGEERIQDTVLRMLVDKYKPLRTGTVISSDEKIKNLVARNPSLGPARIVPAPEEVILSEESSTPSTSSSAVVDGEHKPWLVTFKVPSHATIAPSIKYGRVPPPPASARGTSATPISSIEDPRARAEARRQRKLALSAGRLTEAREAMVDYRLGGSLEAVETARKRGSLGPVTEDDLDDLDEEEAPNNESSPKRAVVRPRNPQSMRAWNSLIEEKIENARAKGHFDNLSGRGKPLNRETAEGNPFIAREEFLMNRIVKRNGAAPPWVEMQQELSNTLANFRASLQESWIRRVVRMVTADRPPSTLANISLDYVLRLRDPEWEAREASYHEHRTTEVNSIIRKYNNAAPYSVRKPYIQTRVELDACFESAAPIIVQELHARSKGVVSEYVARRGSSAQASSLGSDAPPSTALSNFGFGDLVKSWLQRSNAA